MITHEQLIAGLDQEMAAIRDRINTLVDTYTANMNHVAECPDCTELSNVTSLVRALFEGMANSPESLTAYLAMAVKMLHDERTGRNGDLP